MCFFSSNRQEKQSHKGPDPIISEVGAYRVGQPRICPRDILRICPKDILFLWQIRDQSGSRKVHALKARFPRFGSVKVPAWNGSSGSSFRFRRFPGEKVFSVLFSTVSFRFQSRFGQTRFGLIIAKPFFSWNGKWQVSENPKKTKILK